MLVFIENWLSEAHWLMEAKLGLVLRFPLLICNPQLEEHKCISQVTVCLHQVRFRNNRSPAHCKTQGPISVREGVDQKIINGTLQDRGLFVSSGISLQQIV